MVDTRGAILAFAEKQETFRFSDLYAYLNNIFKITKVTLSWYLRDFVKKNILFRIGRGVYTIQKKLTAEYHPKLGNKAVKIGKEIACAFPLINFCVFDGNAISEFQHHLSQNNLHYIEVERDVLEPIFHFLKQKGYIAYLKPDKDFTYNYIDISNEAVIVKPLVTESPLTEFRSLKTPKLEKILVDILCDDDMDYLHGREWNRIFENAHKMYSINRTALLRYASRRNAKFTIEKAIENL